jgi:hypothetical protein
MIKEMKTNVQKEKQNLKIAQDRQKSFADLKRTNVEFNIGDHVYIKVRHKKNTLKLGTSTKLAPRYYGSIQVLARVGIVAYQLALSTSLKVQNIFHVSLLKKYVHDVTHVVNWNVIQVEPTAEFQVEPLRILDRKEIMLRSQAIAQDKV